MHKRRQVGFQSGRDFQLQEKKHVHVHFSQQVDDSGKLKTGVQITRQQNQEIGKYHGVFHRAASIQHHITGDVPKIFPDNTVVSAAKNAMKFTGHTVLAAENAVIRRKDPAHADNRHWHLQFQRMQDSTGNQHTQVHFIRKEMLYCDVLDQNTLITDIGICNFNAMQTAAENCIHRRGLFV